MSLKILEAHEMVGILALFLIVQFGGLSIAVFTALTGTSGAIIAMLASRQSVIFSYGIDVLLVGILLMLLLNRHRRHNSELWDHKFFAAFEAAVLTATCFFAFIFLLTALLPQALSDWYFVLSLASALFVVGIRERTRSAKNLATVLSSIGVGLILGFYFSFAYTILILAVVAFYDYAAVFITKSMVKLARKLSDEDVAFLISEEDVEAIPEGSVSRGEVKKYLNEMPERFDYGNPLFLEAVERRSLPVVSQIQLGEGDLGLPLMAGVSMLFSFSSVFASESLVIGATIGLVVTMLVLKRYKRPLPAIPPLFSFISIASGISLFMINRIAPAETMVFIGIGAIMLTFGLLMAVVLPQRKDAEGKGLGKQQEGRMAPDKPAGRGSRPLFRQSDDQRKRHFNPKQLVEESG